LILGTAILTIQRIRAQMPNGGGPSKPVTGKADRAADAGAGPGADAA